MKRIDISLLNEELKEDIEDGLLVSKNGEDAFVVLKVDDYNEMEYLKALAEMNPIAMGNNVRIITNDINLSEEEFETVKKQLNEAFDATFKPKTSKMN